MLIHSFLLVSLTFWWASGCTIAESQASAGEASPPAAVQQAETVPPPVDHPQEMPPHVTPPADAAPHALDVPANLANLLERLEASATDLHSFTADIRYEKEDVILGRRELRTGDLIYRQDPQTKEKAFGILFDSMIVQNVRRADARHYVFNGRWLTEVDHRNKQFIKREIVPPGRQLDPLKLGEGPFPLPIGQPKAEVLARFDVAPTAVPAEGLLKDLQNVESISLVPKSGTREARDFAKVELHYDRATLLPVGIITAETNGDVKVVRLMNVKRNPELSPQQVARLDVREPDPREWKVEVLPWRQQ